MHRTTFHPRPQVALGGDRIVSHAGARLLSNLADALGLTAGLSEALEPTKQRQRGHDRGLVFINLATAMADGVTTLSDLDLFRQQPAVFGALASMPTTWRTLAAVDEAAARIATARAVARARAWAAGTDPGFYVIDIDGTLLTAHSEKEQAAPTYQHGFGFYPLVAFLERTGEALAAVLRPGNAGSGTAADHITVLDAALAQLPVDPHQQEVIVRTDSAGCSHKFLDHCAERGVPFVVGHPLTADLAVTVLARRRLPWVPAITADGSAERDVGEGAELTPSGDLSGWPPGTRLLVRREIPHPGAQVTFTDVHGYRYPLTLTNHPSPDGPFLEALHRGRGRCEQASRDLKATGLAHLPSAHFAWNEAWVTAVLIAGDLLAWTRGLLLPASWRAVTPDRLRYRLFPTAGRLVHLARRTVVRLAAAWPWTPILWAAFTRCAALTP